VVRVQREMKIVLEQISRRKLLEGSLQISLTSILFGALASGRCVAAGNVCADVKSMDSGAASLRNSLNYTEASPDVSKTCSACGFFQAGTEGCGTCQIFNGPVNEKGRCDSWSAKS
jgi:hypothetical protein